MLHVTAMPYHLVLSDTEDCPLPVYLEIELEKFFEAYPDMKNFLHQGG